MRVLISMAAAVAAITTASVAASVPAGWVGTYIGHLDGGRGELRIWPSRVGGLLASIQVAQPRCVGMIKGAARLLAPGTLEMVRPRDATGSICRIKITQEPGGVSLSEDGCTGYHGAECDFEGHLVPTK